MRTAARFFSAPTHGRIRAAPQTLAIDGGMTGCSPIKF
jgi:hypothetical protein